MLFVLLNLIVIWCLVMLYCALRPDQVGEFILYVGRLETEIIELYVKLGSEVHMRRYTARELAALNRQKRLLRLKLRALIIFLAFLKLPFDLKRFVLGIFGKKD